MKWKSGELVRWLICIADKWCEWDDREVGNTGSDCVCDESVEGKEAGVEDVLV
jgi:hypothetical protein